MKLYFKVKKVPTQYMLKITFNKQEKIIKTDKHPVEFDFPYEGNYDVTIESIPQSPKFRFLFIPLYMLLGVFLLILGGFDGEDNPFSKHSTWSEEAQPIGLKSTFSIYAADNKEIEISYCSSKYSDRGVTAPKIKLIKENADIVETFYTDHTSEIKLTCVSAFCVLLSIMFPFAAFFIFFSTAITLSNPEIITIIISVFLYALSLVSLLMPTIKFIFELKKAKKYTELCKGYIKNLNSHSTEWQDDLKEWQEFNRLRL